MLVSNIWCFLPTWGVLPRVLNSTHRCSTPYTLVVSRVGCGGSYILSFSQVLWYDTCAHSLTFQIGLCRGKCRWLVSCVVQSRRRCSAYGGVVEPTFRSFLWRSNWFCFDQFLRFCFWSIRNCCSLSRRIYIGQSVFFGLCGRRPESGLWILISGACLVPPLWGRAGSRNL